MAQHHVVLGPAPDELSRDGELRHKQGQIPTPVEGLGLASVRIFIKTWLGPCRRISAASRMRSWLYASASDAMPRSSTRAASLGCCKGSGMIPSLPLGPGVRSPSQAISPSHQRDHSVRAASRSMCPRCGCAATGGDSGGMPPTCSPAASRTKSATTAAWGSLTEIVWDLCLDMGASLSPPPQRWEWNRLARLGCAFVAEEAGSLVVPLGVQVVEGVLTMEPRLTWDTAACSACCPARTRTWKLPGQNRAGLPVPPQGTAGTGNAPPRPGRAQELISFFAPPAWTATLRGLASSTTGTRRVRTPSS